YKSFNVWVGNGGYGDSENVLDTVISFKVEKSWVQENYINPSSIVLYKYDDEKKEWVKLPVTLASESSQFLYFTANVPGYSSFVITGKKGEQSTLVTEPVATVKNKNVKDDASTVASTIASKIAEGNEKAPGFGIVSGIVCLICTILYRIKER
ncbi:MAG: PGF-pre-PGF domain-containing protein, partial [Methanobacteriota archaeon]